MNQGANDFVSINILLSEILVKCNDEDLRKGLTKGWYISAMQRCLEDLAYDTFFQKVTIDIELDKEKLQVEMPNNIFNLREVYLFNGECCETNNSVPVHVKRLFNNHTGGSSYTSKIKESGSTNCDPIIPSYDSTGLRYCNIQNGVIMFSQSCSGYDHVRIIANGTGGAIGDMPIIPRWFRNVVTDFVCEQHFLSMMAKDQKQYVTLWRLYNDKLNGWPDGSWHKAERRVKSMDTYTKEALIEVLNKKW